MFDFPINSAVQQIFFEVPKGSELYIKRDDLIDPIISGNKWRKLKFNLIKAHSENKTKLVSFGGAYSNHLLALASAAAKFNFQSYAFVRGDEETQKESEMLVFARLLGMNIIKVSREDYQHKKQLFEKYFGKDEQAFFIDEGGMSVEGAMGCEEIIEELKDEYTDIFLASGTGCTTAGIVNSIQKKKLNTKVHSVVVHKGITEVEENINHLLNYSSPSTLYQLHSTNHRYGKLDPEATKFSIQFQRNTGILLDPIYTAKAMKSCYDYINQNEGKKILFIHTGGFWGNLGKLEELNSYLKIN